VKLLRDAFWLYSGAAGHRWRFQITPIARAPGAPAATIRVELTDDDAEALAAALAAAAEHRRGGGGVRAGGRSLLDTRDVALGLHVSPSTIRSWLSRGGPKGNPFPAPDRRYHGRSYWKRSTIEAWLARQR
jgi:predicted DNA-binding transcriptional regulator AlpA